MAESKPGLLDLTAIARPDLRVKLKRADDREAIYRLPGDPPAGDLLRLVVLINELEGVELLPGEDNSEEIERADAIQEEVQEVLDALFALRNADYQAGDVKLSQPQLITLVGWLFEEYKPKADGEPEERRDRPTEEEPEAEEPPASSTPQRPRSARRSPASSRRRASKRASPSSTSSST